jgi:hypothetical protein
MQPPVWVPPQVAEVTAVLRGGPQARQHLPYVDTCALGETSPNLSRAARQCLPVRWEVLIVFGTVCLHVVRDTIL